MVEARKQPVVSIRLELDGDFSGWWLEIDRDFDLGTQEDFLSGNTPRIADALGRILLNWNFVDKVGVDLPADREGVRRIGVSLMGATMEAFRQLASVPNA